MYRKTLRKHARWVIASSLATVVLAGSLAWAAGVIPGADGVIHGCYNNSKGDLRVIDPTTASCKDGESAIFWSQTGPEGPQGTTGATGATGDTGAQGPAGTDGTNGIDGATGAQGATGDTGAQGPAGSAGATRATGAQGPAGSSSLSGYQIVSSGTVFAARGEYKSAIVNCPSGQRVLGGGVYTAGTTDNNINKSAPWGSAGTAWLGAVNMWGYDGGWFTVYAICANV